MVTERSKLAYEASKWLVILALTVVMAIAGAWVKADVYTKDEVDAKVQTEVEHVEEIHDTDIEYLKEQTERIDDNVQMLVDKLIKEDG